MNSTCFGQFLSPSWGVFRCTHNNGICHTGLLTACKQDQDWVPSWPCSQAVSKPVWHIPLLCVQWKTPDDGRRNCPKHVEFYSKNKFEKVVHLVGFIIRITWRCCFGKFRIFNRRDLKYNDALSYTWIKRLRFSRSRRHQKCKYKAFKRMSVISKT